MKLLRLWRDAYIATKLRVLVANLKWALRRGLGLRAVDSQVLCHA
jgi:hypothetical protein